MITSGALFFITVALVHGQTPCCTSPKFEAVIGNFGGSYNMHTHTPTIVDSTSQIYYDHDNKMMTIITAVPMNATTPGSAPGQMRVLQDFNTHKQYTVLPTGQCYENPLRGDLISNCIPNTAIHRGSAYIGYGATKMTFDTWQFNVANLTAVINTIRDSCTPISQFLYGQADAMNQQALIYGFVNFKSQITDASVFNIPRNCDKNPTVVG